MQSGWRKSGAVALLVLAAAPAAVAAQGGVGTIAGRVVAEQTGEPLEGAVVEVREAALQVSSAADGSFRVDRLKPGLYTVEVRLLGRTQREERVQVAAGVTAPLTVLLALSPVTLEALRVKLDRTALVGRLSRVPGSAHVLTGEQLTGAKLLFDDLHAVLRQVPGVNMAEEEGHGRRPNIGMRGTGVDRSAKVAVLEDGVLAAPAPYAAPAAYYFPVAGRMEAVEVRKGSSQVKYGPWTTGGALNLVSSSVPALLDGVVEVAGGPDVTGKVRAKVGATHGVFGWLVETYQLRTDGFKRLDNGAETGFELQDYLVKLRLQTGAEARLYQDVELKLGRTDEASRETYLGLADADFEISPLRRYAGSQRDRLDTEHRQYQLRHFIRPVPSLDVTTTVYRNEFARNWYKLDRVGGRALAAVLSDPSAHAQQLAVLQGATGDAANTLLVRANQREYYAQGVQSVLGVHFRTGGFDHTVEAGARYHRDVEDRLQHDDTYGMTDGRMELIAAGAAGSQDNRIGEARALALFLEDRVTAGAWTVTPGVRFETIDFTRTDYAKGDVARDVPAAVAENGVDVWVPGIGVSRRVGAYGALFGGVHRGFGPPGPGADERTRPESSVNYELGGRWEAPSWQAQVTGFYNDYTNILGRATLSSGTTGTGELFNGGAVVVKGIELSGEVDVAARRGWGVRVPVRTAYTFTDGSFASSFESSFAEWGTVTQGDELPYLPRHQLFAGAAMVGPRWRAEAGLSAASAMRTRAGSGPLEPGFATDRYAVLNLSGEFAVAARTRLFAGVQNVTDASYIVARRPAGARPGLPRTLNAGLSVTLR